VARVVTLDGLVLKRLSVVRDGRGMQMQCEYDLRSGGQVVQRRTARLTAAQVQARQAALGGLMDALAQELAATELA
jgi:hypothetical protein